MQPEQTRRERFTAYAETLSKRFQTGILANLQERILWVVWKPEQDTQGTIHKRPFTPKGYPASMYKPRQWASVDNALEALATGNFAGIGIMLPAPFVLIDKDATENAPIYDREAKKIVSPFALKLLEQVPSYTELSPNNGLHILTEGRPQRGNFKTPELEMYTNWFSTVTTRHIPGTPLEVTNQQAAIQTLEDEFHPPVPERAFQNTGGVVVASRLSELPPEAANDAVLQELLRGDMTRYGNDHHRADWILLMKLLHWTGDDRQLAKAIFLNSSLGQREKAQDPEGQGRRGTTNYVDRTIDRIIEKRRNPPQRR
jgi:primase-polymerase (primpol)-like protein